MFHKYWTSHLPVCIRKRKNRSKSRFHNSIFEIARHNLWRKRKFPKSLLFDIWDIIEPVLIDSNKQNENIIICHTAHRHIIQLSWVFRFITATAFVRKEEKNVFNAHLFSHKNYYALSFCCFWFFRMLVLVIGCLFSVSPFRFFFSLHFTSIRCSSRKYPQVCKISHDFSSGLSENGR